MLFLTLVLVAAAAAAPIGPRLGVVDGFLATLTKKKLTFDNSGHFKVCHSLHFQLANSISLTKGIMIDVGGQLFRHAYGGTMG
jgi:hypothetical protein